MSLEASLRQSEKVIHDLNQLSRFASHGETQFRVAEAIQGTREILVKRLHDVQVSVQGDFEIKGDRGLFSSILLNLFVNSIESFQRSKVEQPRIEIQINSHERSLVLLDNGGGFSADVLQALKSGSPVSSDHSSSGLGLYLVKENLRVLGGTISFSNKDDGAMTIVQFK